MDKAPITTHILDLHKGQPGQSVVVELYSPLSLMSDRKEADSGLSYGSPIATAITDADGRVLNWSKPFELQEGNWRLTFLVEPWFKAQSRDSFFTNISLSFIVKSKQEHYHVPLLLNEFGYSTYRGS